MAVGETIATLPRSHEASINPGLYWPGAHLIEDLLAAWIFISGVRKRGVDGIPLLAGLFRY